MECEPKNCGILGFSLLTEAEKRVERKSRAERLYKQGFTQQQIAQELHTDQKTISRDLETLVAVTNVKGQGKDTLGRKKSTGRPKGSHSPKMKLARELVRPLIEEGKPVNAKKLADQSGVSHVTIETAIEAEHARIEAKADPDIDRSVLSMSAQEKLDAAIRQHQRKLDQTFEKRVLEEVRRRIDEMILPQWKARVEQAQKLYKHRKGAMDKATFNKIRRALHPDSRHSITDTVLAAAFDTFMSLEKFLLDENDSPTDLSGLPDSLAEWDKMRQKPSRRSHANVARR